MSVRPTPAPGPAAASRTVAGVLAEAADAHATVVLSGHVQPDADALGSTLALAEGLRRRGARVLATFPDPFTLPASLGWLPGAEGLVPSGSVPSSPDVFVSLDAASPGRLGSGPRRAGRRAARRDRRPDRPGAGYLPLRRPGRRHRLLPLRQHPAGDPRARRPAAGHRHRPQHDQPAAVRHRPVRLARAAV